MLRLGAVLPNLTFAADAHYHHLTGDVIAGGPMRYENGSIPVPRGPGLGVKLDREKLREYSELCRRLGSYPYDRDPGRPGWTPTVPNDRWADPADGREVEIPFWYATLPGSFKARGGCDRGYLGHRPQHRAGPRPARRGCRADGPP